MTAAHWAEVRALLEQTLELHPAERESFLAASAADLSVLTEVHQLLSFEDWAASAFSIDAWQHETPRPLPEGALDNSTFGSYRILRQLGRGGMGTVYLAERADGTYEQKVAVKVLQEEIFTPALAERFRRERQILAQLAHPGIARLLDGGVLADGRPYLVLEYVDGIPIDRYCDEHALTLTQRLRLFLRVAEVVQSAHQQLVLHLDLKPANIFVTTEGEPRLLDFGLARILSNAEAHTETTVRQLTPRYASPEQANGSSLGVASDVFSLSTLLYRLLTGTLPYPIEEVLPLTAIRILNETAPQAPSLHNPELKGDLDNILLQGLRKEPQRRYPTVAALAEDLERHLQMRPVRAHADSFAYRAGKFLRRNRLEAIAVAAALAVVAGSGVAVLHSATVARRERNAAERRLADIQNLARFYVTDLYASLNDIPGTLTVRKQMTAEAVKYLQSMREERNGDPKFSVDLANGLFEMAKTEGFPNQPSLGDLHGAQSVLSLARQMVELHALQVPDDPKTPARRGLLDASQANISNALGDVAGAVALEQRAWDEVQPVLQGPKSNRWMQIATYCFFDSIYLASRDQFSMADPAEALRWVDRAEALLLDLGRDKPEFRQQPLYITQLAQVRFTKANLLDQLNRDDEARQYYLQAMHDADGQNAEHSIEIAEHVRKSHLHYAEFLLAHGQVKEAVEVSANLRPPEAPARTVDQGNFDESEYAIQTRWWAVLQAAQGNTQAARLYMEKSITASRRLMNSAPEDQTLRSLHVIGLIQFAGLPGTDATTARSLLLEAQQLLSEFTSHQPLVLGARMMEAQVQLGLANLAKKSGAATDQEDHLRKARNILESVAKNRQPFKDLSLLQQQASASITPKT
ncbi:serine/threonine protein kinase [Terriglobus aquaticus]|uniref:Protein kinase domain-containing protein n=1 Tax=Terriglobus aquaticus TaxID=940139 RepID=A0ABW9KQQ6_9BACT|nr:serine/threonine-protein kinase [Terriglobus aquaticus]